MLSVSLTPKVSLFQLTNTRSTLYGWSELKGDYTLTFEDTGTVFGRWKPASGYDGWFV